MRYFYPTLIVAGILVVLWHIFAPVELTLAARFGTLMGTIEESWIKARLPAAVEQIEESAEAEAVVQRRTMITQRAIDQEADISRRQIESTHNSHWVKNFGANVSDFVCGAGMITGMVGGPNNAATAQDLMQFCAVGDQIRRGMAQDYGQALNGGRTDVMTDMLSAFDRALSR